MVQLFFHFHRMTDGATSVGPDGIRGVLILQGLEISCLLAVQVVCRVKGMLRAMAGGAEQHAIIAVLVGKETFLVSSPAVEGGAGVGRLKSRMAGQAIRFHDPRHPALDGIYGYFSFVGNEGQQLITFWLLRLLLLLEQADGVICQGAMAVCAFQAKGSVQVFQTACCSLRTAGVTEVAPVVFLIDRGGMKTMHGRREI